MRHNGTNCSAQQDQQTQGRGRLGARLTPVAALAAASISFFLPGAADASASGDQAVIVTSTGALSPLSAVLQVGGTVTQQYTIVNGVEALVPASSEPTLAALPGIIVTPDVTVLTQSTTVSTGPHTPSDAFLSQTGSSQLSQAGDSGAGVTVAVMDTGIDNLPDFQGRLIGGVDLSGEKDPFQDSYGHGTFVAGLIAGNGASSGVQYSLEAPGANLVSIKVAG